MLADEATGQSPGIRQLADQKMVPVRGGHGALFAFRARRFMGFVCFAVQGLSELVKFQGLRSVECELMCGRGVTIKLLSR